MQTRKGKQFDHVRYSWPLNTTVVFLCDYCMYVCIIPFAYHHLKVPVVHFTLLLTLLSALISSSQHRGLHFLICIVVVVIIFVS